MKFTRALAILLALTLSTYTPLLARADEIILKNGDKLTGTIGQIAGGAMTFISPDLGTLTIKLEKIQSYKTDKPAKVQLKTGQNFSSPITHGDKTEIQTADQKTTPLAVVKSVNPPPEAWTGSIVFNGALNRGNTFNDSIGLASIFSLRRDNPYVDDRTNITADYNLGDTGRGRARTTTTDNLDASIQYDKFFTEKFYGYADVGYLRDRIAELNIQLTPGVGVGYQWFEQPDFNFNTEGGLTYLYEDYQTSGVEQHPAFRLAYHIDKAINPQVSIFNDTEYIAALEDPANYVIHADAGVQANFTTNFFSQFKVVYRRNDRPASGALKDDLEYLLGVGWKF